VGGSERGDFLLRRRRCHPGLAGVARACARDHGRASGPARSLRRRSAAAAAAAGGGGERELPAPLACSGSASRAHDRAARVAAAPRVPHRTAAARWAFEGGSSATDTLVATTPYAHYRAGSSCAAGFERYWRSLGRHWPEKKCDERPYTGLF
jgi:hypothetical protein